MLFQGIKYIYCLCTQCLGINVPYMEVVWFADSWCQNHSYMGSIPDYSALHEQSGTETSGKALASDAGLGNLLT